MKYIVFLALICFGSQSFSQLVAKVQMDEEVEGLCNQKDVYALYNGWDGQVEPKCSVSEDDMQTELNKVEYLKQNPKFKGEGMVGVYINCEGKAIGWEIDNETKSKELDQQLLEVFKTYQSWTAGTFNGDKVDCRVLISYKIKKGVLTIN